ncbi:unnamed protein product [Caenorhabditis brenneri]
MNENQQAAGSVSGTLREQENIAAASEEFNVEIDASILWWQAWTTYTVPAGSRKIGRIDSPQTSCEKQVEMLEVLENNNISWQVPDAFSPERGIL